MADDRTTDPHLHEQALPGPARLFELHLGDGTTLSIAVDPATGARHMSVLPAGQDTPCAQFDLDEMEAAALAVALGRKEALDG
jgi:hypothetical protein